MDIESGLIILILYVDCILIYIKSKIVCKIGKFIILKNKPIIYEFTIFKLSSRTNVLQKDYAAVKKKNSKDQPKK